MKKMSKKNKLMTLVVILLIAGYAYEYGIADMVAGQASLSSLEDKVRSLKLEQVEKKKAVAKELAKKDLVKFNSKYFWTTTSKVQTLTISNALDKAAKRAQVKFRSTGSPRVTEVSKNIRKVQIAFSLRCSMRDASRFYHQVDNMEHAFFWDRCTIRPDRADATQTYISGTLVTYVLMKDATKMLQDKSEEVK